MAESLLCFLCQGIKIDIFHGNTKSPAAVIATAPLCFTDPKPVSCLIARTVEPFFLNESFKHVNGMTVFFNPIAVNSSSGVPEYMTC